MSANLRPVVTKCGPASSRFVSSEVADQIFSTIAEEVGSEVWNEPDGEAVRWAFEAGAEVVSFLANLDVPKFTDRVLALELGAERGDVEHLLANLKILAATEWGEWLDDGQLVLLCD